LGQPTHLSAPDLWQIVDVLKHAWAERMQETYETGLLLFHIFCDKKNLPKLWHALLFAFTMTLVGSYAGKMITNYFYGV
jgi:hypothetical protein